MMRSRPPKKPLVLLACALLSAIVLLLARPALAKGPAIEVTLPTHARIDAPIELRPSGPNFTSEFTVTNHGAGPLTITRIAPRGDDADVRSPGKLSARFVEGGDTPVTIPAGASKNVAVLWSPKDARQRQLFGHVVLTSSDEAAGEIAVGITANAPRALGSILAHVLSLIVFLPLAGAFVILGMQIVGGARTRHVRIVATLVSAAQCVLALVLYRSFDADITRIDGNDGFQFIEHAVWLRPLHVEYFVGVDGASLGMVVLAALLGLVAVVASFGIEEQAKGYFAMLLVLVTGITGAFVALDLFLFFCFWSAILLPIYFLIGIWGGQAREHAAIKFVLVTLTASAILLLAIVLLTSNSDPTFLVDGERAAHTFSIPELMRVGFAAKHLTIYGMSLVKVVWTLFFLAFAIAIPMVPLHTWLADAFAEAPMPVALLITALVTKVGAYGLLRVAITILPEASRWAAEAVVAFGVANVIYGSLCALGQTDMKRLIAYVTIAQMGFCLIGIGASTPQGIAACLAQMWSQGAIAAMLALVVGIAEERLGTRDLGKIGGLAKEMPVLATFAGLAFMASLGLPGLAGFWGEALALFGAFPLHRALTVVAAFGVVLSGAVHLTAFQRIFLGPRRGDDRGVIDRKRIEIGERELLCLAPLALLCVVLGVWPVPFFTLIAGAVRDLGALLDPSGPDQIASTVPHALGTAALALLP